jgi:hypothetical protein
MVVRLPRRARRASWRGFLEARSGSDGPPVCVRLSVRRSRRSVTGSITTTTIPRARLLRSRRQFVLAGFVALRLLSRSPVRAARGGPSEWTRRILYR